MTQFQVACVPFDLASSPSLCSFRYVSSLTFFSHQSLPQLWPLAVPHPEVMTLSLMPHVPVPTASTPASDLALIRDIYLAIYLTIHHVAVTVNSIATTPYVSLRLPSFAQPSSRSLLFMHGQFPLSDLGKVFVKVESIPVPLKSQNGSSPALALSCYTHAGSGLSPRENVSHHTLSNCVQASSDESSYTMRST